MATWMDMRYDKLRSAEMQRVAAAERLMDEMRALQPRRDASRLTRLYGPLLVRAGSALEFWGARLKTRYAAFSRKQRLNADEYLNTFHAHPMESHLAGK
ncbi:MAG: hypothetical protein IT323_04280 [Anaerolineae bacterium]|nr:hypothetical protein [Anaerolineae bacterium]